MIDPKNEHGKYVICELDQGFTRQEMLEETNVCNFCMLDCPNAKGKQVTYEKNLFTGVSVSYCPSCSEPIDIIVKGKETKYCPFCGQKLRWAK